MNKWIVNYRLNNDSFRLSFDSSSEAVKTIEDLKENESFDLLDIINPNGTIISFEQLVENYNI